MSSNLQKPTNLIPKKNEKYRSITCLFNVFQFSAVR